MNHENSLRSDGNHIPVCGRDRLLKATTSDVVEDPPQSSAETYAMKA